MALFSDFQIFGNFSFRQLNMKTTRPADIFLRNWVRGRDAALDLTVISPMQSALIDQDANNPGYALKHAWEGKMRSTFDACSAQPAELASCR